MQKMKVVDVLKIINKPYYKDNTWCLDYSDGEVLEYNGNELEIIRYNESLECYEVKYLGEERYVPEKVLNKYCKRKR